MILCDISFLEFNTTVVAVNCDVATELEGYVAYSRYFPTQTEQESPADAVKPARRKSMQKLLQFDVFRFMSPNSISPNCQWQCIASRGMFSQALGL